MLSSAGLRGLKSGTAAAACTEHDQRKECIAAAAGAAGRRHGRRARALGRICQTSARGAAKIARIVLNITRVLLPASVPHAFAGGATGGFQGAPCEAGAADAVTARASRRAARALPRGAAAAAGRVAARQRGGAAHQQACWPSFGAPPRRGCGSLAQLPRGAAAADAVAARPPRCCVGLAHDDCVMLEAIAAALKSGK